jgi:acyl dehydratase
MSVAEQELHDFEGLVGTELPGGQALEPVERGDIRRWAYFGVEDWNPRWNDVEVARRLGEDDLVAPPSFFYALDYTTSQMLTGKVEGALPIYGGAHWRFFEPCRAGDSVRVERKLVGVREREGRFAGPMLETVADTSYRLADTDTLLASCESTIFRCRIENATERRKYADQDDSYSDEKLTEIRQASESYRSRADESVNLGEVGVGTELPTLIKGPHTARSLLRHRYGFRTYQRWTWDQTLRNSGDQGAEFFRALGYPPEFADMPSKWHEDPALGEKMGFPQGGDFGPQRVAWMTQLVTDWIGTDADLKEIEVRLVRPNPIGDTSLLTGSVTEVSALEDGSHELTLTLQMTNQKDERSAFGTAKVHSRR